MLFNSGDFLIFFPITVLGYYIVPQKVRYIWLLIASYYFYMNWNPAYALLLLFSTIVTYSGALIIEKNKNNKGRKIWFVSVIVANLLILGYFKYINMIMGYINKAITITGHRPIPWDNAIILPVGISFFTLQALGYLIDVYRGEIYAERNILRYALFISFFPQLVAGPIERSKNLLKQLAAPIRFSYENLRRGLLIMLYGFFLKMVIADRIAIFVDCVYSDLEVYQGFYILIATVFFAIQIYCDFYGYSTIAKGVALTMGIRLMDNFNAPYFSKSIKEFWRRWHISLSTWFRDYLYIPLGGNRKGRIRQYINIMIVFAVSGLWHGANLAFVFWGALHGAYQILEGLWDAAFYRVTNLLGVQKDYKTYTNKYLKMLITFALVCFAWMFFRANSLTSSKKAFIEMVTVRNWFALVDQSLLNLGITRDYFHVLIIAVAILGIVDYQKYRGKDVVEAFFRQNWWFRAISEIVLLVFIILFGCYGSAYDVQQFIYFQF